MPFKNSQWVVTADTLRTVPPESVYIIEVSRLTETTTRHNGVFYDWPLHMSEKEWVNLNFFFEAFVNALEIHDGKYSPALDGSMLDASLAEARRLRRELN